MPDCQLAQFSERPCEGHLVRAHLIPRQVLRRELGWRDHERLYDRRVIVFACGGPTGLGGHHGELDGCTLSVPRSALPAELEQFAEEFDLSWYLQRTYGST